MSLTKYFISTGIFVCLLFVGGSFCYAGSGDHDHKHTKLEDAMSAANKAFKKVRRQASDESKNKQSAKLVAKMIKHLSKGVDYKPKWTADKPKPEQPAYVSNYREEMKKSLKLLKALKVAFAKNDNAKAESLIAEIRAHQKENHKLYKKPKPKKK